MKTTPSQFWWAAVPIVAVVAMAFAPSLSNGFVDIDDKEGLVQNPHLRSVDAANLWWAVTSTDVDAYQPLARILQLFEYAAWGMDPRGYHIASLVSHIAVALGLFVLTGALIRRARPDWAETSPGQIAAASALAAGLFAVHPLRVEVVAWAICQAYLPCAFFTILALLAYLRSSEPGRSRTAWLAGSVAMYAVAMGFYQVPVALPFVLMVLDIYLEKRFSTRRDLLEKLPFFAVSVIFGLAALTARRHGDGVSALVETGFGARAVQSAYAACFYLVKTFIPSGLCHVYPLRDTSELGQFRFVLSVAAILGVTIGSFALRRRYPLIPTAWCAYLLILAPNSGLVRNIGVVAADRYSYFATAALVPALAAGLMVAFANSFTKVSGSKSVLRVPLVVTDLCPRSDRRGLMVRFAIAAIPLVILVLISRTQCGYWNDAVSLWGRAVAAQDRQEWFLDLNYGIALSDAGRGAEARAPFAEAAKLNPHSPMVHDKLGLAMLASNDLASAETEFTEAVRLDAEDFEAHMNLGFLHAQANRIESAQKHLMQAVKIRPKQVEARLNLGAIYTQVGRSDLAEIEFTEATKLAPERPNGFMSLGFALLEQGRFADAAEAYSQAAKLQPNDPDSRSNLGFALSRAGKIAESIVAYESALRINPDHEAARKGLTEVQSLQTSRTAIRTN